MRPSACWSLRIVICQNSFLERQTPRPCKTASVLQKAAQRGCVSRWAGVLAITWYFCYLFHPFSTPHSALASRPRSRVKRSVAASRAAVPTRKVTTAFSDVRSFSRPSRQTPLLFSTQLSRRAKSIRSIVRQSDCCLESRPIVLHVNEIDILTLLASLPETDQRRRRWRHHPLPLPRPLRLPAVPPRSGEDAFSFVFFVLLHAIPTIRSGCLEAHDYIYLSFYLSIYPSRAAHQGWPAGPERPDPLRGAPLETTSRVTSIDMASEGVAIDFIQSWQRLEKFLEGCCSGCRPQTVSYSSACSPAGRRQPRH